MCWTQKALPSWVLEAVVVLFGLRHKSASGCIADVNAAWPSVSLNQPMLRWTDFYGQVSKLFLLDIYC